MIKGKRERGRNKRMNGQNGQNGYELKSMNANNNTNSANNRVLAVMQLYPHIVQHMMNPYNTKNSVMYTIFYRRPTFNKTSLSCIDFDQSQLSQMIDIISEKSLTYCLTLDGMSELLPKIISALYGKNSPEFSHFLSLSC